MPCYDGGRDDYSNDSNNWEVKKLQERADLLARVACRALTELEDNGIADMLLLRDDETRDFWIKHKEFDAKRKAEEAEKLRKEQIKKEALAKLTAEEREVLGIKSTPKKRSKVANVTTASSKTSDILDMIRNRQN